MAPHPLLTEDFEKQKKEMFQEIHKKLGAEATKVRYQTEKHIKKRDELGGAIPKTDVGVSTETWEELNKFTKR
jgi:hypothetical protein